MKLSKKLLSALVVSTAVVSISATSFAALNEASAREIAEKWVPAEAAHVSTKADGTEYEVKFLNKATNIKYEIEVNALTESVTEVKTKLLNHRGSQIVNFSAAEAQQIVLSEFPGATIREVKLEQDNGYKKYEVKFSTAAVRGEMEINPETGVVMERELHY